MSNNRVIWLAPGDPPEAFPDIGRALREPDGLLAAGGDLGSERLLYAYRHGIFPWFDAGQPILWWSPDPRCILRVHDFRISRRLRQMIRSSDATLTINAAFGDVVRACAAPRRSQQGTWITPEMERAYQRLHDEGWAHSFEVWRDDALIGGLYGVAIDHMFFGESMFSLQSNASKFAMLGLCRELERLDVATIDCQVVSAHLITLGAITVPRADFAAELESACRLLKPFPAWTSEPVAVRDLVV